MLEGQILDPGEWPWQDSEAEMTAKEAKDLLKDAVEGVSARELDASLVAVLRATQAQERADQEAQREKEVPEPVREEVLEEEGLDGATPTEESVTPDDPSTEAGASGLSRFSFNRRRN